MRTGFLVVAALQERREAARHEAAHGQVVSGIQAAREPPRHDEQPKPNEAAEKVRPFEHRQRKDARERRDALRLRRRGPREHQHRARQQREHRQQFWGDCRRERPERVAPLHDMVTSLVELVDEQDAQGGDQRQQVVNDTIDRERRQELVCGEPRLQQQDHQRLEHADAARHMADERDEL